MAHELLCLSGAVPTLDRDRSTRMPRPRVGTSRGVRGPSLWAFQRVRAVRRLVQLLAALITLVALTASPARVSAATATGVVASACRCKSESSAIPAIRALHGCCAKEHASTPAGAAPSCCASAGVIATALLSADVARISAAVDSGDALSAIETPMLGRAPPRALDRPPRV